MGFFDKIRGAVAVVTGGAADVKIEYPPFAAAGDTINIRVIATAKSNPIKGDGIFVDLRGIEEIRLKKGATEAVTDDVEINRETLDTKFQIAGNFQLGANETGYWEGQITIPGHAQPTFDGSICDHGWGIRGRLSMFGNDPDTGYLPIRIGLRG